VTTLVVQPLTLDICFTDSHWLAAVANEHGNRADCANDEGRREDQCDDQIQGIDGGALHQIPERTRGCRILGDRIENDVQDNEENKTEYRRQEEEHELPCASPGVDECKDKGSSRKIGQQYAGQIIVNAYSGRGNRQQATDYQEDKRLDSVLRCRKSADHDSLLFESEFRYGGLTVCVREAP